MLVERNRKNTLCNTICHVFKIHTVISQKRYVSLAFMQGCGSLNLTLLKLLIFSSFFFFFSFFARANFNVWGALLKFLNRQDQFIVHQVIEQDHNNDIILLILVVCFMATKKCTLVFDNHHVVSCQFTETRLMMTLWMVIKTGNLEEEDFLSCQSPIGRPFKFKDWVVLFVWVIT